MLKMKHLIGVKTDKPIDVEDFLYEMVQAFEEKGWKLDGRGATVSQLKWAGLNSPIDGLTVEESLDKLEELGYINVERKNGTSYHTLAKHDWVC